MLNYAVSFILSLFRTGQLIKSLLRGRDFFRNMTCFEGKQSKQRQDICCTLWFMHMHALVRVCVGGRAQTEKNALLAVTYKQSLIRCAALMYKFRYLLIITGIQN